MQQNTGNFFCKMIARKIHHFFFSFTLILLLGISPAHSAGYTCDSSKVYSSCNAGYYLSSGSCNLCSLVNNTTSTTSCTTETSITGGKRIGSGTKTCNGKYTGGNAGSNGTSQCTGCSSYSTTCNVTSYSCSCNSGYHASGSGSSCTCVPDCSTSKSCSSSFSGYSGTYNECTQNQSSQCYKSCSVTCSGNDTSACPANATCTYNTSYPYTGTQYYGGSCSATPGTCPVSSFTCNTGWKKNSAGTACEKDNVTITYAYNGGVQAGTPSSITCQRGLSCTLQSGSTNNMYRGGYRFVGWNTSSTATTGSTTITPTGNTTVYAIWEKCAADTYHPNSKGTTAETYANVCPTCPTGYPYSDAGATAITQCYSATKSRAMTSCTQNACSNPDTTGCASVTCASSCSCAGTTCSYVAYSNSAGTGDGTIKSGCSTNAQSCTKAVSSLSAKSNYYVNGTTSCPTCSSYSSTYTKSDGGNISSSSCYTNITRGCTQNNGSTPSGCASVTSWNACSCAGGTYKKYASGSTSGTTTNETCTKTPAAVTASSNYYVSGTSCKTCSSFSSTYTLSDGGNISSNYCYRSLSKTGSQLDPTLPTGCATQSTTACTPGTCSYKDYYNATDTTCTPSNCTKTHSACTSANTNYYLASGVAKTCSSYSSSYPSSGGGNITYSSCYGTFSKSGSQLSCSTPSGCASATCGTCTPGTCTYTKYASGTIKSDCTPTNCTKPVASVTASANNYVSGTSCPTCTSYNSSYPYSDGGGISYTSCFKTVTKTGSQNACSQPANSASYTCNSCTPGTCTYRDYNGATDGTCTPTNCTQTVKSATCNANYFGTTSCTACSSFNSSYPYSDQGTTSSNYCYASKTNTGSQNACTKPENCYSVTCNSCTPGTCSWRDYYNATDTTCTPTNCNQTVKSVTANANYYVNGTSCSACNTIGDKTYTSSVAGNSGGTGACFKSCTKACTQQSTPTGAYSVTHGATSTSGTHYYGGSCSASSSTCSLTVNSCAATYYKNGNACSLCSGLADGLYPNSNAGNSSGTNACYTNSLSGKVIATANARTTTDCDSKYYKSAHTVNYGSTSSCNSCPATASGSDSGRDTNKDCYVSCSAKSISNGTTTVVNAKEYYNGSAYPACTYNVNCNAKHGASGNKTTNPACTVCATGQYSAGGTNTCADCQGRPDNSAYTGNASSVGGCPWTCNDGYNLTSDNQCGQFCTSGITHIHLGNGLTIPLYNSARTSPAINVKWNNSICYGSLATGQSSGALNVKVGNTTYHATN